MLHGELIQTFVQMFVGNECCVVRQSRAGFHFETVKTEHKTYMYLNLKTRSGHIKEKT